MKGHQNGIHVIDVPKDNNVKGGVDNHAPEPIGPETGPSCPQKFKFLYYIGTWTTKHRYTGLCQTKTGKFQNLGTYLECTKHGPHTERCVNFWI